MFSLMKIKLFKFMRQNFYLICKQFMQTFMHFYIPVVVILAVVGF